jgi:hypothetical protein
MLHPQVLVYESDSRLVELLRRMEKRDWVLREPRRLESCLELLRRAVPSALVIQVGQDLVREFMLLERVGWLFPDTSIVAVGEEENAELEALAYDLGATCVLFPPKSRALLPAVIESFMKVEERSSESV